MKKYLLMGAAIAALSAPAFADNSVNVVTQSNTGNSAIVDQTGSQKGGDSLIDQSGANNSANVTQSDDNSGVSSPMNFSDILQSGDDNSAVVVQDTSTFQVSSDSLD